MAMVTWPQRGLREYTPYERDVLKLYVAMCADEL